MPFIFNPCVRWNFQPRDTHGCGSHCRQFPWKTTLFISRRVVIKCRAIDDIHWRLAARSEGWSIFSSLCAQWQDRNYQCQTKEQHSFPAQDRRHTVAISFSSQQFRWRAVTLDKGLPGDLRVAFISGMLVLFHTESR